MQETVEHFDTIFVILVKIRKQVGLCCFGDVLVSYTASLLSQNGKLWNTLTLLF